MVQQLSVWWKRDCQSRALSRAIGLTARCIAPGEPDRELTSLEQWNWSPNVHRGPSDYRLDLTDAQEAIVNFNGVGAGVIPGGHLSERFC